MAYILLGNTNQLQLEIPTEDTKDWGTRLKDNFVIKIIEHDHSGNGKGVQLGITAFPDNLINDIKIRLRNDQFLRARNSSNTGDVNLIKANSSNNIELGGSLESITSSKYKMTPVNSDPISPIDGQLQYSDGTHRSQGLWQYQTNVWVSIQGEVGPNSVNTNAIQDNSITLSKMSDNSVSTNEIVDGSITLDKMTSDSVSTNNILDNSITNAKMADNSINTSELVDGAVTKEKLSSVIYGVNSNTTPQLNDSNYRLLNQVTLNITTLRPILVTVSGFQVHATPNTSVRSSVRLNTSTASVSGPILMDLEVGGISVIGSAITSPVLGTLIIVPSSTGSITLAAWGGSSSVRDSQYTTTISAVQL